MSFTDDAGNDEQLTTDATGTVAAVVKPPLTATVHGVPSSHNGQDAFTFELRFSEDPKPDFSYTTVRDHAFTVTGGSVTYVRRLEPGKNNVYRGVARKYRPDLIVRPKTGNMLVLETEGQPDQQTQAKRRTLQQWTQAVNQHGGFGNWVDAVSTDPGDVKAIWARHAAGSLAVSSAGF